MNLYFNCLEPWALRTWDWMPLALWLSVSQGSPQASLSCCTRNACSGILKTLTERGKVNFRQKTFLKCIFLETCNTHLSKKIFLEALRQSAWYFQLLLTVPMPVFWTSFISKWLNAQQVLGLWISEEMAIFATSGANHRNWARFHKLSRSARFKSQKRTSSTKKIHIYTYRRCRTQAILDRVRPIFGQFLGLLSSLIIYEMKILQFCHFIGWVLTCQQQKSPKN